jgi:hypothetical protein
MPPGPGTGQVTRLPATMRISRPGARRVVTDVTPPAAYLVVSAGTASSRVQSNSRYSTRTRPGWSSAASAAGT